MDDVQFVQFRKNCMATGKSYEAKIWSVFSVNGPEILLSQQMTMSSPSPNPNSYP